MKRLPSCALAILLLSACDQTAPGKPDQRPAAAAPAAGEELYKVPLGDSPARGPAGARVTLVMFSDFECPFCARVEATVAELRKSYGDDLRVVWKHFPLPNHERALPAALAAEAAREQGRFWEMHDQLLAHQEAMEAGDLEARARDAGVDLGRFRAAAGAPAARARIEADRKLAEALGVRGTPSFFINGRRLIGAQPTSSFQTVIDQELVRATDRLRSGVGRDRLYAALVEGGLDKAAAGAVPEGGKGCHGGACPGAGGAAAPRPEDSTAVFKVEAGESPARGAAAAPITVVLFSDFQCPFCKKVEPTLAQLEKDYPGKVRLVWKNFPLDMHPGSKLAAAAAVAAHGQGKFWPMHDRLLASHQPLDRPALEGYARELGLEPGRFQAALDAADAVLDADLKQAATLGVTGTPTVFVNGRRVTGAYPVETFKAIVEQELARQQKGTL
jgi:protein-disulfide isomerase